MPAEPSPPFSPTLIEHLVRRKRRAFFVSVPVLLFVGAAWARAVSEPRRFGSFAFFAAIIAALIGQNGYEWWTLRSVDPWHIPEAAASASARPQADLIAHEARSAQVRPYATYALAGAILAVTVVQFVVAPTSKWLEAGGLVKPAVRAGEWWRLLTASYMHGSIPHFVANAGVLLMLGRLIEIYDRRLRVPLVYLLSVLGGGLLSTLTFPQPAVGASGGFLGLAGYLLVTAGRPPRLTPEWVRRKMLVILGITVLVGTAAFYFIDNALHAGGAATGALLGFVLPPAQPTDPFDRVDMAGGIASVILAAGAVFITIRLLA